ncbi:hypothetical protein G6F46_012870 [Rhizopus delemar]|uniref:Uncharacterized protein n=2 Tax=Rhizopus TaxID=4842 RepID=A0A9P6YN83_9FUNG|nr:hypothetical protein G6F55_012769 [Rhizopus delemar]KAG1532655.1 hypothetical protein G6F51_013002 [Rhizopus arrhizus]KAG1487290.1 hypothetical protein G6F54_012747 [Rhizopus delemar]KAG1492983.1 hypothetical protein G6F53_012839 [Rhizopus delemar]KAG1501093.1 hypothetical protein G6F52_012486 [Rhizopus delemar]
MSYGSTPYPHPPPAYDEEASQPLMGPGEDMYKETVSNSSLEIRLQFVRKVYSILATQLFATSALSAVYMFNDPVKHWVQSSQWLVLVSSLGAIGVLFALLWKSRSYPLNYGLLALFTLLEAHAVGTIVTFYSQTLVLEALVITLGVFIGLTLFTLQSKWDFSGLGPFLYAGIWILLIVGIVQMFFPFSKGFELAIAIGAYSPEDYIAASVSLYVDVLNLFLRILEILSLTSNDD